MAATSSDLSSMLYEELWRRCAGPLHHLPRVGERVFYLPQGHLDQVAASSNRRLIETLPETFNLPSRILCRVVHIQLRADETDEIEAQITLIPDLCQDEVTKLDPALHDPPKPVVKSFCKVLTATDICTKLHVRQQDARECFPPLDMTLETPSQKLVAKDLLGYSWHFKHVHGGNPRRHLLSSGWKRFVKAKRLVSGDSVIFLRGENGELRVGIRRVFSQGRYVPQVLAAASNALFNHSLFTVFYRPSSGSSPFIVGVNKYIECATNLCSIGMRFSMRFERDDHLLGRCTGTIVELGDASPYWKDSQWRCLKVKWDESATMIRRERVSPWEIDHIDLNMEQRYVERNRVKKSRQLGHHSSAGERNKMHMPVCPNEQNSCFQLAVQPSEQQHMQNTSQMAWPGWVQSHMSASGPLVSSQQNWIENVGQPNWTALQTVSQICQQGWVANAAQSSHQQRSNISVGPLFSNEDNWLHCMLHHDEAGCLDELGPMLGGPGNGLNTISCCQFPTVSPPIHFSQLDGGAGVTPLSRVSINSEESVQGEARKRKKTSVGDEDRQVKSRIEPTQCGAGSNSIGSNETHYSSASEGEPYAGKCNQESTPIEGTAEASDRPLICRLKDLIFDLLHQLKNYVV